MLSDAYPDYGAVAPADGATATFAVQLFVPDADATVAAAERAGAQVQRPVSEAFHGSRMGTVLDPFGVRWMIGTHVRDVSETETALLRTTSRSAAPEASPAGAPRTGSKSAQ